MAPKKAAAAAPAPGHAALGQPLSSLFTPITDDVWLDTDRCVEILELDWDVDMSQGQIRALEKLLGFARSAMEGASRVEHRMEAPKQASKKVETARKKGAKKPL